MLCTVVRRCAAGPSRSIAGTVTVVNDTPGDINLTAANWSLGGRSPSDYTIASDSEANFGLTQTNARKGRIEFDYSSGTQTCKFIAGHDIRESFGWWESTKTPYQWVEAKSIGGFSATCEAKRVQQQTG